MQGQSLSQSSKTGALEDLEESNGLLEGTNMMSA